LKKYNLNNNENKIPLIIYTSLELFISLKNDLFLI
jgi:hypothetical protein